MAIALAERWHDRQALASARISVGAALLFVDYPRGCAHLEASLDIAGDLADGGIHAADAYVMLGSGCAELYQFANANRFLGDGIAFARAHDLDRLAGYMEAWQVLVNVYQGRWESAGDEANALLAREQSGSTNRLMALVALGRLRTRRGDPGADGVLDEALALATRTGTLQRIAPVRCARAEAAWLAGDWSGVRSEARAAFDLAAAKGHPWFLGELAYWLWQAGDLDDAPPGCAAPYASQIAGRWREAADAWASIGCPYEQARALADGDATAQRDALAIFDRLGARPPAERLRQQMRAAGVPAIPRGPRSTTRDNPAGLTMREVQVLALVAEGWQNARIATRLSRSQRTVEHHLASILAKLAVNSRSDAVAVARERGILPQK
jgi:DNA-binding CsgD family transcriptional regulator